MDRELFLSRLAAVPLGPRGAFETACERLYLPALDRRKANGYGVAVREARDNQRLPREALDRLVVRKLRRLLTHAARSCPFYTESFAAAGVTAADLRSAADIQRFPLLTKRDVFDRGPELDSLAYRGNVLHGVTSGSTGTALRFRQGAEHDGWIEACWARGMGWWGIRRADRRLILWGRPVDGGARAQAAAWLKQRLRNSLSFNTFEELTDSFLRRITAAVRTFRPRVLYGYGSSLGALAEYMARAGEELRAEERPRLVVYTGDHMYEPERQTAERAFGASVVSLYGSSEAGSVGYVCPAGSMHVSEDHIHVEFLREDGSPAPPGELAEMVVTTLNNFAMPVIRYRLGDLGSYRDEACSCGVTLRVMNLEVGKVADRISTSTKALVSPYSLDYISKHLLRQGIHGIRQFLVEQTALDDFVLHIVRDEPFDPRCESFFVAKMREFLGEQIRIEVRFTETIPVSASGKRRWFLRSMSAAPSV